MPPNTGARVLSKVASAPQTCSKRSTASTISAAKKIKKQPRRRTPFSSISFQLMTISPSLSFPQSGQVLVWNTERHFWQVT